MTLPPSQRETLRLIRKWSERGISLIAIAENLGISHRAAERRLDRLIAVGVVEDWTYPSGWSRLPITKFRLTPKGRELL